MLIRADARQLPLRDRCVQCVVTSPPYFGLRDYGVAGQIGFEATPDAYVHTLVAVFREVRRVLKNDGVCWLNLGDSYAGQPGGDQGITGANATRTAGRLNIRAGLMLKVGAKPKDLLGIPWRVAFALQADGWYLRSDIIWAKPNPMPESVMDRPTKAHEYLFLLSKCERYYYDADAIKEASVDPESVNGWNARNVQKFAAHDPEGKARTRVGFAKIEAGTIYERRNRRTVWTIPTMPYSGAHFATMPEKLVEPCILAGSRVGDRILDPFLGSGTVGEVAERLSRRWVGCDLRYHDLARVRTAQRGLNFAAS
jgi:DNA modification methylase